MERNEINKYSNETFSNIRFLYRDTDLMTEQINSYSLNQIITELSFLFTSKLGGGVRSNLRYLIASADTPERIVSDYLPPEANEWGLVILKPDIYLKVLDIYEVNFKTQILLLQIPEEGVASFKDKTADEEIRLIEKGRKDFEISLTREPFSSLLTDSWISHLEDPIGMDSSGTFYSAYRQEDFELLPGDSDGLKGLTDAQRNFNYNQWFLSEVNNGGLDQYFFNPSGDYAHLTVISLELIGASEAATVLQKAIDLFPDKIVPPDRNERMKVLKSIEGKVKEIWNQLDQEFYSHPHDYYQLNADYIRSNEDAL